MGSEQNTLFGKRFSWGKHEFRFGFVLGHIFLISAFSLIAFPTPFFLAYFSQPCIIGKSCWVGTGSFPMPQIAHFSLSRCAEFAVFGAGCTLRNVADNRTAFSGIIVDPVDLEK